MPEYPDIEAYLHTIRRDVLGRTVQAVRLKSPFLVRTIQPPLSRAAGCKVVDCWRIGKRVVLDLTGESPDDSLVLVLHLMKAGRLKWGKPLAGLPGKIGLCAFDFEHGTLLFTEAGRKRRASIHVLNSRVSAEEHDPGGLELHECSPEQFHALMSRHRHTLKRTLTDPRILAGVGSAYADEILLRARFSPMKRSTQLSAEESAVLLAAAREVLTEWRDRIIEQAGSGWPKVTAFRPEMAAHGKFGEPCPQCGSPIQRIVYAETETNYCAACQTGGTILKDRALSRLLKDDWPRDLDDLDRPSG